MASRRGTAAAAVLLAGTACALDTWREVQRSGPTRLVAFHGEAAGAGSTEAARGIARQDRLVQTALGAVEQAAGRGERVALFGPQGAGRDAVVDLFLEGLRSAGEHPLFFDLAQDPRLDAWFVCGPRWLAYDLYYGALCNRDWPELVREAAERGSLRNGRVWVLREANTAWRAKTREVIESLCRVEPAVHAAVDEQTGADGAGREPGSVADSAGDGRAETARQSNHALVVSCAADSVPSLAHCVGDNGFGAVRVGDPVAPSDRLSRAKAVAAALGGGGDNEASVDAVLSEHIGWGFQDCVALVEAEGSVGDVVAAAAEKLRALAEAGSGDWERDQIAAWVWQVLGALCSCSASIGGLDAIVRAQAELCADAQAADLPAGAELTVLPPFHLVNPSRGVFGQDEVGVRQSLSELAAGVLLVRESVPPVATVRKIQCEAFRVVEQDPKLRRIIEPRVLRAHALQDLLRLGQDMHEYNARRKVVDEAEAGISHLWAEHRREAGPDEPNPASLVSAELDLQLERDSLAKLRSNLLRRWRELLPAGELSLADFQGSAGLGEDRSAVSERA